MALKPDNQNPTEKDLQMKLNDIAKNGGTDFYGMGILLKDAYRNLSDKQILKALKVWAQNNTKMPEGKKQSADDKPVPNN